MIDTLSMNTQQVKEVFASLGEPGYRAVQYRAWQLRGASLSEMTDLPKQLRQKLADTVTDTLPKVERKLISRLDGTIKYLFRLYDGEIIESVFMRYKHGNTLCISCQVGCLMGCKFCASTLGGKVRNLLPSEMLGQIIAAQADSGERISNIVMMGIGEPLDNYDNVCTFLRLVGDADGLNIGYRHISLSTCGIVPRIYDLAKEAFPITLSISLHASNDEARSSIMPINNRWNIKTLLEACVSYYRSSGRRISFEYTLIAGKNDTQADARALGRLLKEAFQGTDAPLHVNLIRVNEVAETGMKEGRAEDAAAFARTLCRMGLSATVRRRLGRDVNAACGQLRRREMKAVQEKQSAENEGELGREI